MRKAALVATICTVCFTLSACSYTDIMKLLPATPTAAAPSLTPTATVYMTATETPTLTPTQPTPTFTATPTLIYAHGTPPPTLTYTPPATQYFVPTGSAEAAQPLVGNGPFSTILVSGRELFWGSCEPASITATVKVAEGVPAFGVLVMLRLEGVETGDTTGWGRGAIMDKQGNGVFTYTLTAKSFTHYREYMKAWGQYQFVAYDANLKRLGASTTYLKNLTIEPCP